jgi:hypothetical protein
MTRRPLRTGEALTDRERDEIVDRIRARAGRGPRPPRREESEPGPRWQPARVSGEGRTDDPLLHRR